MTQAPSTAVHTYRAARRGQDYANVVYVLERQSRACKCTGVGEVFARAGFVPDVRLEIGSNEAIKEAVAAGMGIAVVSLVSRCTRTGGFSTRGARLCRPSRRGSSMN
ncbi:MAG TPA: LysR substrate-binding domain-containing protein [Bradyrhizobium sp.]